MKRAYLVLGPESSGTRLMTRLLIAAGCFGDSGHEQRLDDYGLEHAAKVIVWRRSLPHGGEWPLIPHMVEQLLMHDYEVTAVVMSRDWHSMIISQQQAPHAETVEEAVCNIRTAYGMIFAGLRGTPFEVVNYEALIQRPLDTFRYLAQRLGLPSVEAPGIYIYDGNERYYREALIVERG